MTYQSSDTILFEDKLLRCYDESLLHPYWKRYQFTHAPFSVAYTSCWRGYEAAWQISDGALWLIGLDGKLSNSEVSTALRSDPRRAAAIDSILTSSPDRPILADWIDGLLTAHSGEMIDWGWAPPPKFEFTHQIKILAGRVVRLDTYDEIEMCERENRNAVFPTLVEDPE
ncbi:MAG: hypothetical protein ING66_10315 [Rhodocyclaceae bacterium]|nr:hypothetical protein [Rhodocyclaceae bacterium]MCA3061115.1 hypothetical protein [Rhodocyclaceae bacterium]MCA3084621.1 hypothetical protein [Rhodocyclaceae bacterium]